jgi:antitoxin component of MazEF toxin-antitoxin module
LTVRIRRERGDRTSDVARRLGNGATIFTPEAWSILATLFVSRDDDVCGFLAGDVLAARVSERRQVETRHEMFSRTEENGGDGEVHLVNEAGLQVLPDRRHSSAEADIVFTKAGCRKHYNQSSSACSPVVFGGQAWKIPQ